MKKKTLHIIFGLLMVIGFFVLIGTEGADKNGAIDFVTSLKQSAGGLMTMIVGAIGLKLSGYEC